MRNTALAGTILLAFMLIISVFCLLAEISPERVFGNLAIYLGLMGIGGVSFGTLIALGRPTAEEKFDPILFYKKFGVGLLLLIALGILGLCIYKMVTTVWSMHSLTKIQFDVFMMGAAALLIQLLLAIGTYAAGLECIKFLVDKKSEFDSYFGIKR